MLHVRWSCEWVVGFAGACDATGTVAVCMGMFGGREVLALPSRMSHRGRGAFGVLPVFFRGWRTGLQSGAICLGGACMHGAICAPACCKPCLQASLTALQKLPGTGPARHCSNAGAHIWSCCCRPCHLQLKPPKCSKFGQ